MRRVVVGVVVAFGLVGCGPVDEPAGTPAGGGIESEIGQIESTLDQIEGELAGE